MMEKQKSLLRLSYDKACNSYLLAFCRNYGFVSKTEKVSTEALNDMWILGAPGTFANVGDYYVAFEDIQTCVDMNIPFREFDRWYSYNLTLSGIDSSIPDICLNSWLAGAPRLSRKQIFSLKCAADKRDKANAEFQHTIDNL
jgi:hypothetical protein